MARVKAPIVPWLLCASLALTLAVYWPGLSGPFLFDDIPNLELLGVGGGVIDFESLLTFMLGGSAGPSGRPLSLLTFLLNDFTWPSDPFPFKYTNLMLHLLNGVLLCWLCLALGRAIGINERRLQTAAVAATAVWLLHPLNVSTVLFVVQRMTELSALCVIAGLGLYVHGRQVVVKEPQRGFLLMSFGIGGCGVFAVLCKENGVLLPLYAVATEYLLLRPRGLPLPARWRVWAVIFLFIPLTTIVAYVVWRWPGFAAAYSLRDFSPLERLLTEARVLCDYAIQVVAPQLGGTGLFHDDYTVSRGLLRPPTTLPSVLAVLGAFVGMLLARRRRPLIAFSLGWFFAGHALESTIIPLELYFEHRNYLAMAGPIMAGFFALAELPTANGRRAAAMLASVVVTAFAAVTIPNTNLWGNGFNLAQVWASENPGSVRAQQYAADLYARLGRLDHARERIEDGATTHPQNAALALSLVQLDCLQDLDAATRIKKLDGLLMRSRHDPAVMDTLSKLTLMAGTSSCQGLETLHVLHAVDRLLANPAFQVNSRTAAYLYYLKGRLHANLRQLSPAVEALEAAFEREPSVDLALQQAAWLSSAELWQDALEFVAIARRFDEQRSWPLRGLRRDDIDRFARALEAASSRESAT